MNSRQIEILRKASPHLMPRACTCVNAIIMANELSNTIRNLSSPNELSTCDTKGSLSNPDEMLNSIRNVCSPRECELIDMISSIRKSKEICNTYKMMNPDMFKG